MQNTEPLRENRDFKRIYSKAKGISSRSLVLYYLKNKYYIGNSAYRGDRPVKRPNTAVSRLGITVTKKLGNSVHRNRARRIIREAYRMLEPRIAMGYDIVIVAKPSIIGRKSGEIASELEDLLDKAGILS